MYSGKIHDETPSQNLQLTRTTAQSPENDNQNKNNHQQYKDDNDIHNVKNQLVTR